MRRWLALMVLALAVAPGTWWRTEWRNPEWNAPFEITAQALRDKEALAANLGPFEVEWFGGYSALLATDDAELLAFSDGGKLMRLSLGDPAGGGALLDRVFPPELRDKTLRDVEAATYNPGTGAIWLAIENANAIYRFRSYAGVMVMDGNAVPPPMAKWEGNAGPEAFARLSDGRFVALRERFDGWFEDRRHEALLFAQDPVEDAEAEAFELIGPEGFSPTDMVQLPDGQLLVLFRRVAFSIPPRFESLLAIGDPGGIKAGGTWRVREVARISANLSGDNFEGLAVSPGEDGRLAIWLISDSNHSAFQQTLLWRLSVDPDDLKPRKKKARGSPARL